MRQKHEEESNRMETRAQANITSRTILRSLMLGQNDLMEQNYSRICSVSLMSAICICLNREFQ